MRSWILLALPGSVAPLLAAALLLPSGGKSKPSNNASATAQIVPSAFEQTTGKFFGKNCVSCHNAKMKAGGIDLTSFNRADSVVKSRETWEAVQREISAGQMPPKGLPRPNPAELKAFNAQVTAEFDRADRLNASNPGRVTAHRLNRAEYNNTIRDLVGVDSHPADDFPQDDSGYGFDNIGDALSLTSSQMDRYFAAAEKIARAAVFGQEPLQPTLTQRGRGGRRIVTGVTIPARYDETGLSLPNSLHTTQRFPVNGEYLFRFKLDGIRPYNSEALHLGLWIDGKQVQALDFDPTGGAAFNPDRQDFGGREVECRLRVTAGDHWIAAAITRLYEGLPTEYGGPNPSKRHLSLPEFKVPPNFPPERVAQFKARFEARRKEKAPTNDVRVSSLEIGGPYHQAVGPETESLRKIFTCGHLHGGHSPDCARKIVRDFGGRAFRRPLTAPEIDRFTGLVSLARKQGDSFEDGICLAVQAILVSPHFLFRIENDPIAHLPQPLLIKEGSKETRSSLAKEGSKETRSSLAKGANRETRSLLAKGANRETRSLPLRRGGLGRGEQSLNSDNGHPISQYELASRLSYFLWSSMPDDTLRRCANTQTLRDPAILAAQVRRMLKDPKASALAENFGGQWLQFRALESVHPDKTRFPDFDDYLRMSMRRETELFFENVVRDDRSILDLLTGKYTFLNERLADFYGIPGVEGPDFRRVDLNGTPRGGILTQASVLTVTSYANRTSPVLRGKWILANLLNAPPPAPPPGVPNLDVSHVGSEASLRQQLEAHRKNPTCAACHARMDPLGFGLENFDAIGAWRENDGKIAIDASGSLPDGRNFRGPDGLKGVLNGDRAAFASCVASKLLTYALGRGLERYDRATVKTITKHSAAENYRFSNLVLEIVASRPFQMRKGDQIQ